LFIAHCLLLTVIYLTYSYGAWLGLMASFIFLLIIFYQKRIQLGRFRLVLLAIGLIFLVFVSACLSQIPGQKFQDLMELSYPSLKSRLIIWQSAWQMTKDHPLVGIGPGLFQKYYLDYQTQMPPYLEWAVPQPHNLFLAFWLQTGLFGLLGFIWLLALFFRQGKSGQLINYFLMAAMIYLLAHGLIDTTYWKNDLAIIFWLITGLSCIKVRFAC
jgi:putative inorganic carbon (HCO3(-)) transporter